MENVTISLHANTALLSLYFFYILKNLNCNCKRLQFIVFDVLGLLCLRWNIKQFKNDTDFLSLISNFRIYESILSYIRVHRCCTQEVSFTVMMLQDFYKTFVYMEYVHFFSLNENIPAVKSSNGNTVTNTSEKKGTICD